MKLTVSTTNAPAAIGPYSQAVWAGNTLYVSGQLGIVPSTGNLAEGGIESQAKQALENIQNILFEAGLTMADVVKTTCLLADIKDFAAFNAVYAQFFPTDAPARSAFAVRDLPKGALTEIEVIACKG